MPKRDLIVRLEDVRINIERLQQFLLEIPTEKAYHESLIHKLAFERIFQIIGEALFQISKDFPEITIHEMGKIIGLRHILSHDYFKINHQTIWRVAQNDITVLLKQIEKIIDDENLRLFGTTSPDLDN